MTVLEAAYIVLVEAGEALHVSEITKRSLSSGLWHTSGKTPEATVSARLIVDVNTKGPESLFKKVAPATFAVNERVAKEHKPSPPKASTPSAPPSPKTDKTTRSSMTFLAAAQHVLEHYAAKQPMHYRTMTELALDKELIETSGRTPEATMNAQLLTDIRRQQRRGEQPRFTKHGRGFYGLARWMGHGLAFDIDRHNRRVRGALLDRLKKLDPIQFEELIAGLLAEIGFDEIEVTPAGGDGGIDVRGTLVVGDVIRTQMAVQVKRWKPNVQAPTVQQVRGSLGAHEQGLIITTSNFSKGAIKEAARADATPVGLMNGDQLVRLLVEYRLGVSHSAHEILELDEGAE
jgi:restriction system protein